MPKRVLKRRPPRPFKDVTGRDDVALAVRAITTGTANRAVVFHRTGGYRPSAAKYLTTTATRVGRSNSIVVTIGRPNYEARQFLKLCRRAKAQPKRVWYPGRHLDLAGEFSPLPPK